MKIREATTDDMFRLIEMTTRFLLSSRYGEWMQPSPEQTQKFIETVMSMGVVLVAEIPPAVVEKEGAHTIIGMIGLTLLPYAMTDELHADEIAWWVEPEYRNGRVGPYLLRSAEAWATTHNAKVCKMVAPAGTEIGGFYRRAGYTEVETIFAKKL